MFIEIHIKTYNYYIVLLINYNTKVFKKAEYIITVTKCKLLGLLIGVYSVAFAITCIICLLECYYLAVLYKLYCAETLTLLTLIALYFAKFIDRTFSVTAQSI